MKDIAAAQADRPKTDSLAEIFIRGPCSGPSVDHLRTSSRRARSRSSATPSPNELSCSQDLSGGYSAPRPLRVISATCRWTRRGESIQQRALLAAICSVGARRFVQNRARKVALDTVQNTAFENVTTVTKNVTTMSLRENVTKTLVTLVTLVTFMSLPAS